MGRISVVITVKNEEKNIARCLDCLKWADEIIIVDNGSVDSTLEICKQYTDKIFSSNSPFTGIRVNEGIKNASCVWILNVDADELVDEPLKNEILQKIAGDRGEYNGYFLPFRHYFMGRWLKYGGWYPTYIKRLYRRGFAKYLIADHSVQIHIDGRIGYLNNPIFHYGLMNIQLHLRKLNLYTTNSSKINFGKKKVTWFGIIFRPPSIFIKRYILLRGFLDGFPGFVIAVLMSLYMFIDKMKLKELEHLERIKSNKNID